MRVTKFRIWNKRKKSWESEGISILKMETIINTINMAWDGYEIMQFTGLKDKNRKEIYEGDIVRQFIEGHQGVNEEGEIQYNLKQVAEMIGVAMISTRKGIVMQRANITSSTSKNWIGTILPYKNITRYRCEVIGNIYENPELLP